MPGESPMWIAQTIGIEALAGLSLAAGAHYFDCQPSGWQQANERSNSLYRDPPSGKGAPDEEKIFICRGEPFACHPNMGRYTDLHNHLLGIAERPVKLALSFLPVFLLLTGCNHHSDASVPTELMGTWVAEEVYTHGGSFESTVKIAPNGRYTCHVVHRNASNATHNVEIEGTFQVKDGVLIDTMTKHSQTNAPVPTTFHERIVRMDRREMVLSDESYLQNTATNTVVWRKVSP